MSLPDGKVTDMFGGEEREFLVRIPQLRAIQTACGNIGPAVIAQRLARGVRVRRENPKATVLELVSMGLGDWTIDMVTAPILHGLVAGGTDARTAGQLVKTWIDDRGFDGLIDHLDLALLLVIKGVEAEPESEGAERVGESKAPETKPETARSTSAPSTPSRPARSAGPKAKRTNAPLANSTPSSEPTTKSKAGPKSKPRPTKNTTT